MQLEDMSGQRATAGPGVEPDDPTLREQLRYYCARAPEYEQWWYRRGRYDLGPEGNRRWLREIAQVRAAFDAAPLGGEVLELAGGTGVWTEMLAARARRVTVIDASQEMLALNAERLERAGLCDRVVYQQADLYSWQPEREYDTVFFGFWLSHVPSSRLETFVARVAQAMCPGGWLGVIDSRPDSGYRRKQGTERLDAEHETRRIDDGRTFRIVKRYDEPGELEARLWRHGINAPVRTTDEHLLYAIGQRQPVAAPVGRGVPPSRPRRPGP